MKRVGFEKVAFGAFHNHKLLYALHVHAPPVPTRARSPLWCSRSRRHCVHRRQSGQSVISRRSAPRVHTFNGSQTTCGDRIRYSGSRLAHGDAESASRATNIERYPALPPDESARPGAALHRTRGNARGGGPWQPWANCRGRPALRPCRMCPAARVGLTSPPGSHTHGAIRKTRGTYNSTWRKSIWRREC